MIFVKGWNWFGREVQQLMFQEFTEYLTTKGLYNLEALNQLIENTRDEIETSWRPIPVMLTLVTLAIALYIAYYQPMFRRFLGSDRVSGEYMTLLAKLGVLVFIPMLAYGYLVYSHLFARFRRERAIYIHCLSAMRLLLLKR